MSGINAKRENRIKGIVDRISSEDDFDSIKWITQAPVQNFCRSAVDEIAQKNAELHNDMGLEAKIVRQTVGENCKWCDALAGEYVYPDVPKEVYQRHDDCDCIVEYMPGDGRKQDVWSKQWSEAPEDLEARKNYNTDDLKPDAIGKEIKDNVDNAENSASAVVADMQNTLKNTENLNYLDVSAENKFSITGEKRVDFSQLSNDAKEAWNRALRKVNEKFTTTLQKIEAMGKKESFLAKGVFASTKTQAALSRSIISYNRNPLTIKRLKELRAAGYMPNIPDEALQEYLIMHELGHTVFAPGAWSKVKSLVGQDVTKMKNAQKEIEKIYNDYVKEIGRLEKKYKDLELKFIEQTITKSEMAELNRLKNEISNKRISIYSMTNPDEFVAEAFAQQMLNGKYNATAAKVMDVLNKYFGR